MQFEWDDFKNLTNIAKHGVSFEEAMYAFLDPSRKIRFNTKHSKEEKRFFCFGKVDERVYDCALHCQRSENPNYRRRILAGREDYL
jgi:uncharacterized DUF497 family protein